MGSSPLRMVPSERIMLSGTPGLCDGSMICVGGSIAIGGPATNRGLVDGLPAHAPSDTAITPKASRCKNLDGSADIAQSSQNSVRHSNPWRDQAFTVSRQHVIALSYICHKSASDNPIGPLAVAPVQELLAGREAFIRTPGLDGQNVNEVETAARLGLSLDRAGLLCPVCTRSDSWQGGGC